MTILRWLLGGIAMAVLVGWLIFSLWADGFRRSFGASGVSVVTTLLPPLVLLLTVLSLLFPGERLLLHLTAGVMALVVAGGFWLIRESPGLAIVVLVYCGAWFRFYWLALRAGAGIP